LVLLRMATHSVWSEVGATAARLSVTATSSPAANGRLRTSIGSDTPSNEAGACVSTVSPSVRASGSGTGVNTVRTIHAPTVSRLVSSVARTGLPCVYWTRLPATVVAPSRATPASNPDSFTGPSTTHSTS
jgi:hypothetical protein